jgi:hypothetical protein
MLFKVPQRGHLICISLYRLARARSWLHFPHLHSVSMCKSFCLCMVSCQSHLPPATRHLSCCPIDGISTVRPACERQAFQKARQSPARLFSNALLRLPSIPVTRKEADFSALLARYESIQIVFPTAVPARRITASGALRCTPGSVANPLNR